METINKLGLGIGGLDDSALSLSVIDSDEGSWSTVIPEPVIITEHEIGNLKYEYDAGSEGWKLRTGRAGTTGKPQVAAGELKWLCKNDLPNDAKKYVWQKINTDSYGNPVTIATCINTNPSMQTSTWDPATGTTGIIWRRLASIEPNTDITCEVSCKKSWAMKAINENNAFMLPIARRYGSLQGWGNIYLKEDADVKDRGSSSHWAPVMYGEDGMSNLIQSIGELGGTFVYQTKEGCGCAIDYGIGIASGIEFYDDISIRESYNCHEMRPKPTRACAPLGPGGKYGKIIIQSVNPKHPWQFQLSADFDIGSCGGWDPGSHWVDCIPLADGPICGTRSYYGWGGRYDQPPGLADMKRGLIDGSVTRLTNQDILWTGQFRNWCATYRPGEINCGGIGIGTAQFQWTSEFKKDDPFDGCITSNRNGGLITGIMNDSPCRYSIDQNGFIHAPNPDWMGKYGVNIPCANNPLFHDNSGQDYLWGNNRDEIQSQKLDWAASLNPSAECYHWGLVNGKVMSSETYDDASISWWAPDTKVELTAKLGDVKEGTIRIPAAKFSARIAAGHAWDWDPTTVCSHWGTKFGPGGGIIRGVKADIWYLCHVCTSSGVEEHHYMPYSLPFIDTWGVLHLPQLNFTASPCCGTYLLKPWTGRKGIPIYNKGIGWDPQLPPSGTGGINPGSGGGGGGYVPIPRT